MNRGILPPPVGVIGGDCGHVHHGGGERERQLRGGIDTASCQIKLASLEGGVGGSKGGSDRNNNDAHSDNTVGGGDVGLHVAVDPPRAEMGDGVGGRMTMTMTAGSTASC